MEEPENYNSDEEISPTEHSRLLEAVSRLDKTQHIKKVTRTEPSLQVSEYHLSKPGFKSNVQLHNLVKSLNKTSTHTDIAKKLNKVRRKVKTLPKPLEKPQQQRIKRSVGFENLKKTLDKWEPLIHANDAAEQLKFPLNKNVNLGIESTSTLISRFRLKNELELEMEKVLPKKEEKIVEEEFPLTMEEMLQRRKEAAKMRAQQSYKEAKARRQSKIKSKKYHRIQRREKVKQQLKEFEHLQKTDPEAALLKLEEIERVRAEERHSLRHRSTGKWAQNKQVRAKYDRESRQVLAQQLSVSRDLTQKINKAESSDEDDIETPMQVSNTNSSNPWINGNIKPSSEVADFVSGYRKYWNEKNKSEELKTKFDEIMGNVEEETVESENEDDINIFNKKIGNLAEEVYHVNVSKKQAEEINRKSNKKRKKNQVKCTINSGWEVEEIEEMFDEADEKIDKKLKSKYENLKKNLLKKPKQKKLKTVKEKYKPDLKLKSQKRLKPEIDEALNETNDKTDNIKIKRSLNIVDETPTDIDPTNFIAITPKNLKTQIPTSISNKDALDDNDQQAIISEAFQDDDIVDEFRKDKEEEVEKNTPKDIDLSLPGWGSWGGSGVKKSKKRFIIKMPKKVPRKDDNKGDLIIKEHKDVKVKAHQVSEVPFPFTSVKDYEASIRAPIGNSFVPETAHRRLIKPAVVVKSGTIIEPMDENQLVLHKIKRLKKGKLK